MMEKVNLTGFIAVMDKQRGSAMTSVGYHEPLTELSEATRDMHRAIVSLMEEL